MYLFIGFVSFVFALLDVLIQRWNGARKIYLYAVITFSLFLIVGYRDCGFDMDNYMYYFRVLNSGLWKSNAEILGVENGYAYLNYVAYSYRQLLLLMAFFTIGLYSYFIYKYSPLPFFSIFLLLATFIYPFAMGQYRQALAISIVLLASLYREKRFLFIGLIVLAVLFHVSSILAVLLLFVPAKICSRKSYVIFLLLAFFSNLFLGSIFFQYIDSLPEFVATKLIVYIETEKGISYGLNLAMLLRLITFSLFWCNRNAISQFSYGTYFFNIYFLSLLIYLGFGFLPQLGGRGSIYFYFFELILAGMVIAKESKYKLQFAFFFFSISIYRQLSFFAEWRDVFIPYKSDLNSFIGL